MKRKLWSPSIALILVLGLFALIVCLVLAFQADLFVTGPLQRSQNYGNAYAMFYLGIVCTPAFPVGLIITLASAFAVRASVAAAGDDHGEKTQE